MKNMEMEFKWDANSPRAFEKMLRALGACGADFSAAKKLYIRDAYLDDEEGSFEAQKLAFRVRNTGGVLEATFKTRTEVINGKAVRREETMPLPGVKKLSDALIFLNRKKNWKGLNVAGLSVRFEIRNRRSVRAVFFEGAELELAFDSCEILVCGRILKMKEIELELKSGPPEKLDALCARLSRESGLSAMRFSKVKTAVSLLSLWG